MKNTLKDNTFNKLMKRLKRAEEKINFKSHRITIIKI